MGVDKKNITAGTLSVILKDFKPSYITPKMYGAVGDGVADDTAAIQKCIDENDTVFFPAGVYAVKHLELHENSAILGENRTNTIIRRHEDVKLEDYPLHHRQNFLIGYNAQAHEDERIKNIEISNLTVDGMGERYSYRENPNAELMAGRQYHNILIRAVDGVRLVNVCSKNALYDGANISACNDVLVQDCIFENNGANIANITRNALSISGRYWSDKAQKNLQMYCRNIRILNNTMRGSKDEGMQFGSCAEIIIDGNNCYENGDAGIEGTEYITGDTYILEGGKYIITKNIVHDNGNRGITDYHKYKDGTNIDYIIEGNVIYNQVGNNIGIEARGNSSVSIKGNHIIDGEKPIVVTGAKQITFIGNVIKNPRKSVAIMASDVAIASDNIIVGDDNDSGILTKAKTANISDNYFEGLKSGGAVYYQGTNGVLTVKNNTILNCSTAVCVDRDNDEVVLEGNRAYDNRSGEDRKYTYFLHGGRLNAGKTDEREIHIKSVKYINNSYGNFKHLKKRLFTFDNEVEILDGVNEAGTKEVISKLLGSSIVSNQEIDLQELTKLVKAELAKENTENKSISDEKPSDDSTEGEEDKKGKDPIQSVEVASLNLLAFKDMEAQEFNGVSISVKDNLITLNGTLTANTDKWSLLNAQTSPMLEAGDYWLGIKEVSGSVEGANNSQWYYYGSSGAVNLGKFGEKNQKVKLTTAQNRNKFFLRTPATFNNYQFYLHMNQGESLQEYIPYGEKKTISVDSTVDAFEREVFEVANKVRALQTEDTLTFAMLTDMHVYPSYDENDSSVNQFKEQIEHIGAVNQYVDYDGLVLGGDYVNTQWLWKNKTISNEEYGAEVKKYASMFVDTGIESLYPIMGNHDSGFKPNLTGSKEVGREYSSFAMYENNLGELINSNSRIVRTAGKPYYYADFAEKKLRLISIATNVDNNDSEIKGVPYEVAVFLKNTLESLPIDYDVMVFGHIPFSLFKTALGKHSNTARTISILNGFHNHEIVDLDGTSTDCDFRNKTGKVIAYISGHYHGDRIVLPTDERAVFAFPEVTMGSAGYLGNKVINSGDYYFEADTPSRELGTITQDLWDSIIYNAKTKKLHIIRYGAGTDREV